MSDTNPDIPQENDPRGEGEPDPEYFDEDDDDDEIPPLEEDPSSLPPGYESIEEQEQRIERTFAEFSGQEVVTEPPRSQRLVLSPTQSVGSEVYVPPTIQLTVS